MAPPRKAQKQSIDPAEIFRHAESFFRAITKLHHTSTSEQARAIWIPITVLSAFASELYFKCLLCIETGTIAPIHLLLELFNKLSPDTQNRLEAYWDKISVERREILDRLDKESGQVYPRDLRSNLASGSDGFKLIRYVYEGGVDFVFNLSDLPIALRNTVLEMKPEWVSSRQAVINKPHPVFIEGKNDALSFHFTVEAIIDSQTTPFQWAVRWTTHWRPDVEDGALLSSI